MREEDMQDVVRRPRSQTLQQFASDKQDANASGSFVSKLYRMVDSEPSSIVSWIRNGTAFCIVDPKMMAEHCLPKYFRHKRLSSLIRQLNFYSFYRVTEGQLTIYQHSYFRKGRPDLLVNIKRRSAGKAKDPWFDPLAKSKAQAQTQMDSMGFSAPIITPTTLNNGTMCYSPMAKSAPIDNMSPALKPAMTPVNMPPVDLSVRNPDDGRWDERLRENDSKYPLPSPMQMKNDLFYVDDNTQQGMSKQSPADDTSFDMDIQDFLTDECSIASAMDDFADPSVMNYETKLDDYNVTNKQATNEKEKPAQDADSSDNFEEELLMDLANVEPGTWDAPLSPLNYDDDVSRLLDVSF